MHILGEKINMTLNTDWRAVTDKIGRKHLEASGQNDFNLGMWLCTMEIPVIHSETVGELYFRTNLFNHLTRGTTEIKFERFMGYKCNAGFAPNVALCVSYRDSRICCSYSWLNWHCWYCTDGAISISTTKNIHYRGCRGCSRWC